MRIKLLLKFTTVMLLLGMMSNANAVSLSLDPSNDVAAPGDTVSFDILYDFTADPTLGGGFDVFFDDSVLDFVSWTNTCNLGACDPGFSRDPDISAGLLSGIAFGNFGGLTAGLLGTLVFGVDAGAAAGVTALTIADTLDNAVGPFVSAITFAVQTPEYSGAEIEIMPGMPVPEPATWMLMLGGLGALLRFRRRHA